MRTSLTMLLAALACCGCKMNVNPTLYVSDLRAVAWDGADDISTSVRFQIEVTSVETCEERSADFHRILSEVLGDYVIRGCAREDFTSYMLVNSQIPITNNSTADSLFYVTVFDPKNEETDGRLIVGLRLDPDKYRLLNARIQDEFFQTVDLAESKISIELNNDEREPSSLIVMGSFLNGEPMHYQGEATLYRRGIADIELSNVGSLALEKNGSVYPLALDLVR